MTHEEKLVHYATAPRASAGRIRKIEGGDFRVYWLGKLRGRFVSLVGGRHKCDTRGEAITEARQFRESCRAEARERGLIE